MHHWVDLCIIEYIMHHWVDLCIIEYTDASLNILMHHWIYLCIIEWIHASAGHQLDLCIMEGIYASWNEFMHQPWLTYRRFIFLRQYCRYMFCYCSWSSMTCGCVVTWGNNRRWLMNMLWCVVDDLWMRRHIGFRMTYECVVMGVVDLLIRHVLFVVNHSSLDLFTLWRGWLLNMLWCIVNDLWMRRHIGFRMTSEPVVVCVADLLIRHVLFIVNHSLLDLFTLCRGWLLNMLWCIVNDLWMRRHIGFRMTSEPVLVCRWLINTSRVVYCELFVAGFIYFVLWMAFEHVMMYCRRLMNALSRWVSDDLWTCRDVSLSHKYVTGCFLCDRCRGILIWTSVTTRFSQMKRPCLWKTSSSFHWWSNKLLCIRVTTRFACLCRIVQFPFPTTVHWHCKGWRAWKRSSGPVIFSRENMSALWMISLWRVMPVRSLLMRYIGMMGFCGTYHIMVLYIPGRTNWELF